MKFHLEAPALNNLLLLVDLVAPIFTVSLILPTNQVRIRPYKKYTAFVRFLTFALNPLLVILFFIRLIRICRYDEGGMFELCPSCFGSCHGP